MNEDPFEPRFDSLLPSDDRRTDPVEVIDDLRGGLKGLADTVGTFELSNVLDDHEPVSVADAMLGVLGVWKIPDVYTSGGETRRFVNPSYRHRNRYADVYSHCECGTLVVRDHRHNGDTVYDNEHRHGDDCKRSWRHRVRADLLEQRAAAVRRNYRFGVSGRQLAPRLGLEVDSGSNVLANIAIAQGIDVDALRGEAKRLRTNTECALLALGYDPEDVGRVWGVADSTIRYRVAEYADWDLSELYELDYRP